MRTYPRAKCAAIALLAVALGCSSSPKHDYLWRSARPLGAEATAARPPLDPAPAVPSSEAEAAVEAPASLTLDAAVGLALAGSPELAAAGWDVRVAEAAAWQAGFRSNPEIAIESEKILGSGGRSGFDSAAASMTLEYTLPLGGKRGKRVSAADAQGRLMAWDYEAARLDIYTDTRKAFLAAVVAQEREALAVRTVELAVGALDTVTAQVAAGRSPAIERTRAEMAVVEAESVLRTSGNAVSASYSALAARWGATVVNFERVDGALTPPVEPPPAAEARNGLAQAPALARYSDALDALD
ncbi:TolC family protein, partial [Candidatus Poribacteria bacterium]|nr:TolC family protein [Candidatus Poribacteria bacterium]